MADTIINYELDVLGILVETGENNTEIKQVILKLNQSLSPRETNCLIIHVVLCFYLKLIQ